MTRVSSSEQIFLLLRERLQRMDRGRGAAARRSESRAAPTGAPLSRLQSLAGLDQIDPDELRRTLVRALLSEELGEAVANDPSFVAVADEVYRLINESDEGRALIENAESELRGPH